MKIIFLGNKHICTDGGGGPGFHKYQEYELGGGIAQLVSRLPLKLGTRVRNLLGA